MIVVAALLGALAGVVTGLVPGIHVNTVTALLLAVSAGLASLGVEYPAFLAFTCALAISHTFFDVVPGLFLGIPGDEAFAQLPGHRLVKGGEGVAAIRLSVLGSAMGLALGLAVMLVAGLAGVIGALEAWIRPVMFLVLAGVSAILVLTDRPRGWSLFTFLASGLLGIAVFGSPLVAGGSDAPVNALFPSLAGLFGVAGLLYALGTAGPKGRVPVSAGASLGLSGRRVAASGGIGGAAGLLVGLLPGLGAANAATLLLLLEERLPWRKRRRTASDGPAEESDRPPSRPRPTSAAPHDPADARSYLVTTSSLNTSEALFAIAALYVIQRSRSGASIAVEQILGGVLMADLPEMAAAMAVAGVVAAAIMWRGGPRFASAFGAVNETGLNWGVVAFLVVLTAMLLGLGGLAILAAATAVGMVPLVAGVRRAQLMGFFLVPAMLFFSGFQGSVVALLPIEQRTAPLAPLPPWVMLSNIVVAVGAAAAVGLLVYFAARRAGRGLDRGSSRWASVRAVGGMGLATVVLLVALLGRAYPRELEHAPPPTEPAASVEGRIDRVVDGDTFEMASMGRRFRVRLKGIDAPEVRTIAGRAARDWATARFTDERVTWRPLGVDIYGRLVAEVHLGDGTFVNAETVRSGHARAVTGFPYEHRELFVRLEAEARAAGRGTWASAAAPPPSWASPAAPDGDIPAALARWDDNRNGRISCAEARRHGIAPVRRGHPAYAHMRDANDDGVVCN